MTETRERILNAAERLFAEQGYAATSLRQIIAAAQVNLAAIHYHFGSKEDLLNQLIVRKAEPVNQERMALLDRCEAEAADGIPAVEKVLEAFLAPPLRRLGEFPQFVKLMGRMYAEGIMPLILQNHFQPVITRFFTAMRRAVPQLSQEELGMRFQFVVGAMAHTMFGVPGANLPCAPVGVTPADMIGELVTFLSGGLRAAPAPRAGRTEIT